MESGRQVKDLPRISVAEPSANNRWTLQTSINRLLPQVVLTSRPGLQIGHCQ